LAFLGYLIARAEFTAATKMRFNGNTCEKKFVATRRRSGGPFHATALGHVSRLNCWMIFERWLRPRALDGLRIFTAAAL